ITVSDTSIPSGGSAGIAFYGSSGFLDNFVGGGSFAVTVPPTVETGTATAQLTGSDSGASSEIASNTVSTLSISDANGSLTEAVSLARVVSDNSGTTTDTASITAISQTTADSNTITTEAIVALRNTAFD